MDRSSEISRIDRLSPFAFLAIFLLGTWPTLYGLGTRWLKFDESYSHGFMVLAVSLFLSIRKWQATRPVTGFYPFWLLPLALSVALYLVGGILLIEAFQQVALLPIVISGLMVLWGWRQTQTFFLTIGILLFTIPVWDYLSWYLQLITVAVNQFILSWLDIEFIVEGVIVYFPGVGAFEIAHGCSGLRYLLVGMTLTVLYCELNLRRLHDWVWLFGAGIMLALVANWIRVFVIIYVGYKSDMTSSLIQEHDFFGWWVFAGTLVPLFFFARWLERKDDGAQPDDTAEQALRPRVGKPSSGVAALILGGLLFVVLSWWTVQGESGHATRASVPHEDPFSDELRQWLPLFEDRLLGWRPMIEWPDRTFSKSFFAPAPATRDSGSGSQVFLGLYSYDYQRPQREIVQYHNHVYDPERFLPNVTFTVPVGASGELSGLTLKGLGTDQRIYIAYGYYVEGRWETNDLQAKLAQLPGIFNSRTDASLLVIGLACTDCDGENRLKAMSPALKEAAQDYLDRLYD